MTPLRAAVADEQIQPAAADRPAATLDETRWKQAGAKRWLWVAVTRLVTRFSRAGTRGGAELAQLLGSSYRGFLVSDRHRASPCLDVCQRHVWWAHLTRDMLGDSQYTGPTGAWGQRALEVVAHLFARWHRFKHQDLDRATWPAEIKPIQETCAGLLAQGAVLPAHQARGFCTDLTKLAPALGTFLTVEGVAPTTTAAEPALRPAVLWRQGAFGSHSDAGLRFVERILTVTATCRQQDRHLLSFLTESVSKKLSHAFRLI